MAKYSLSGSNESVLIGSLANAAMISAHYLHHGLAVPIVAEYSDDELGGDEFYGIAA